MIEPQCLVTTYHHNDPEADNTFKLFSSFMKKILSIGDGLLTGLEKEGNFPRTLKQQNFLHKSILHSIILLLVINPSKSLSWDGGVHA